MSMHAVVNEVIQSGIRESMMREGHEGEGTGEYVDSKVYTCI